MVIPTHIAEKGSAPSFREREETRSFYTEALLHTESFTHKHFYTQTLSHRDVFHAHTQTHFRTETFTRKHFNTQTLLYTDTFTHIRFYMQMPFYRRTHTFTHKRFYTQKLLHTDAFPHRPFYTQTLLHTNTFTHIRFYTRTLLHANTFTYRRFYTQTLLHSDTFTHRRFSTQTLLHTDALHKKLSSSATPSCIISQCLVSSCIILDVQTENTIREFDTWDGHHCRTPWCCKLHASHRSRRKHPQRYNEPNSLVTSTTSCTNLLHTRTIQCKECVLRTLRPRLLRLTSKHHCRIDMQTEQWSSLWTYQFPHRLPHQTNQAPHGLARIH